MASGAALYTSTWRADRVVCGRSGFCSGGLWCFGSRVGHGGSIDRRRGDTGRLRLGGSRGPWQSVGINGSCDRSPSIIFCGIEKFGHDVMIADMKARPQRAIILWHKLLFFGIGMVIGFLLLLTGFF